MKNPVAIGADCAVIHFIVEITTFYILYTYIDSEILLLLPLLYDFLAFVPQGIFGMLNDLGIKVNFSIVGAALMLIALLSLYFGLNPYFVVTVLGIGNAMVHVHAAEVTLRVSNGKMTPSALFVSGGSFGLILGRIMGVNRVSVIYVLTIQLLMFLAILLLPKINVLLQGKKAVGYDYANSDLKDPILIALATIVVAVRAFMGYGIPTSWNKTMLQTVILFCCMGVGKALGGVLIDKVGIRKTVFISTLVSMPFLLFGDDLMMVSLIGVMFFSMTMAVTLALLVSVLPEYPGAAFGFTTVGLFLGSCVSFMLRFDSFLANAAIVIVFTVMSYIILRLICKRGSNE